MQISFGNYGTVQYYNSFATGRSYEVTKTFLFFRSKVFLWPDKDNNVIYLKLKMSENFNKKLNASNYLHSQ